MSNDDYKLQQGDQFAIEPFSTNGYGAIKNGPLITIFRVGNINKKKNASMDDRVRLQKFKGQFKTLPFSPRWVDFLPKDQVNAYIDKYKGWNVLDAYNIFVERGNGMVAQAEHTVIVDQETGIPTTWWEDFDVSER